MLLCPVRYCDVTYIVALLRHVELKKIMIFEKTIREDGVEVISLITVEYLQISNRFCNCSLFTKS